MSFAVFAFRKTWIGAAFAILWSAMIDRGVVPYWIGASMLVGLVTGAFCAGFNAYADEKRRLEDTGHE